MNIMMTTYEYYDDNVGNYCRELEDDTTVGRDVVYMHSNPSWHGITVRTCAVEGKNAWTMARQWVEVTRK